MFLFLSQFIKHTLGIIFFILGLAGSILPILPGFLLILIGLKLLEDINFFKFIQNKLIENTKNLKDYTLNIFKKNKNIG